MNSDFEQLAVWKKGCRLAVLLYDKLKNCKDLGLYSQMTRAAVSIPSNIAEGAERKTDKDFIHFLLYCKRFRSGIENAAVYRQRIEDHFFRRFQNTGP